MDMENRLAESESIIQNLKNDLARKYEHVRKIKMKNDKLRLRVMYLKQFEPEYNVTLDPLMDSQSASIGLPSEALAAPATTDQITQFHEETGGWSTEIASATDATMNRGLNSDADLGNFLQRPIRIAVLEWTVNDNFLSEFNPWELLHDNPVFQSKIANYELLRHNIKMKFVVSGTPFHYGRLLVSYNPYFFDDEVTKVRSNIPADLVASSQKPHVWLDPANNQGGEMSLPFFYPRNFVSITSGDHRFLGKVDVQSTQVLRHANGGDDPVYISVFAWAEDVKLSVPTAQDPDTRDVFYSQSNVITSGSMDEYGAGIVSKPASAVAKAAGMLTRIPSIAPYARASQICASAVGSIASLFGMSRPTIVTNPAYYKPFPQGNLPNVDTHECVTKLALDSKNEVTIDPRVVGLPDEDEMGILDFVKRESYLTSFDMTSGDGVDAPLFDAYVRPTLFDTNALGTNATEYHLTPMAYMANAFEFWHGSVTYKFQIVKSKFHKGKILIQYDPMTFEGAGAIDFNTNYSRIIDLAAEDEFEFTVGWCQSRPWLKIRSLWQSTLGWSVTGTLGLADLEHSNGVIRITVLNKLSSPSVDTPISFNVMVKMEDDALFAQPCINHFAQVSLLDDADPELPFDSQSAEVTTADTATAPTGANALQSINSEGPPSDQYNNVFFGESPTTIRELLKRYVRTRVHVLPEQDQAAYQQYSMQEKIAPFQRGYDVDSGDADDLGNGYNFVQTTFMSYFIPCYAGWRGSLRKKFNFPPNSDVGSNPTLTWGTPSANESYVENIVSVPGSRLFLRNALSGSSDQPTGGLMGTNLGINDTLEAEFPYYHDERFIPARALNDNTLNDRRLRLDVGISKGPGAQNSIIQEYNAVGDDFSLHFFTGVPILYMYPGATPQSTGPPQ
jgi:hypothetical protein